MSAASVVVSASTHLLVAYLFVGGCGGSRSGFVLAFRAGKVAVTASWCAAPPPDPEQQQEQPPREAVAPSS